jgi:hypothetical protein
VYPNVGHGSQGDARDSDPDSKALTLPSAANGDGFAGHELLNSKAADRPWLAAQCPSWPVSNAGIVSMFQWMCPTVFALGQLCALGSPLGVLATVVVAESPVEPAELTQRPRARFCVLTSLHDHCWREMNTAFVECRQGTLAERLEKARKREDERRGATPGLRRQDYRKAALNLLIALPGWR